MAEQRAHWAAFLRLWFLLFFSYLLLKLLIDLITAGYVDLRTVTVAYLIFLPLGQAIIVWFVTRGSRA